MRHIVIGRVPPSSYLSSRRPTWTSDELNLIISLKGDSAATILLTRPAIGASDFRPLHSTPLLRGFVSLGQCSGYYDIHVSKAYIDRANQRIVEVILPAQDPSVDLMLEVRDFQF